MDQVRWGIIGVGDVTEVKSGPAFSNVEGSAVVAVMRRNGELAKDYAMRHGIPKWTDDADELIHLPEVNAVYIATPPDAHMDYAMRVAKAGKPIYVEKPMARSYAECTAMLDAAKAAGVPLFVAYYRRMLPRFLKIRDIVESGRIGEVRAVVSRLYAPISEAERGPNKPWRVRPEIAGGGLLFDLASHLLDYLDMLFGPIKSVHGHAANQAGAYTAEDIVAASYRFASGVHGTGLWCFTAGARVDTNEIIGSEGRLVFSTFADEPIHVITKTGAEDIYIPMPKHVQEPLIQTMVDELRGIGKCPSTGESAARTSWVLDELVKGYYRG